MVRESRAKKAVVLPRTMRERRMVTVMVSKRVRIGAWIFGWTCWGVGERMNET